MPRTGSSCSIAGRSCGASTRSSAGRGRSVLGTLRIPIFLEGRIALEHAALLRDPILWGDGVPRGDGRPVLLIPGFLAGDASLRTMAAWLKRVGYRPCRARMRANVD